VVQVAATATRRYEESHEHAQGSHEHQSPRWRQRSTLFDHVGADGLRAEMIPAPTSSRLDERCGQRAIVCERPLGRATMLPHPEIELLDEDGQARRHRGRPSHSASTQMLQQAPRSDAHDWAAPAAPNPAAATTTTTRKMAIERSEQLVIDCPNSNAPTSEPHPNMNNRTNKLPDRQRAVSSRTEIVDEVVEVRTDRLLAKSSARLVQEDGPQSDAVM